jgi:choline/glycine/proline betaine transport protein
MASEVKTGRPGPFAHVSIPDFSISAALILGFIVLTIVMWFVTSSDSGSFVIVMLPGLMRGLSRDHLVLYRYEQWYATEQEAEVNRPKAYADEEALEGPPAVARGN